MSSKLNKVAILGLGVTGQAATDYFRNLGYEIVVWDEGKGLDPFDDAFDFYCLECAVKSPGIKPDHGVVIRLKSKGVKITTDLDIFMENHKSSRVVGVTGTDGKSTVSYYVSEILRANGVDAVLGGNFGYPLLSLRQAETYVLELSSYQLASATQDHNFFVGCITNVAYDHITYHGSMEMYADAKCRVFERAAHKILGTLDQYTKSIYEQNPDAVVCNGTNEEAITEVCKFFGVSEGAVSNAIPLIKPLEHRIETVTDKDGILIINDSKATNLHSLIYALEKLGNNIVLILGGRTKGEDFSILHRYKDKIKKIYLIGECAEKLRAQITCIPCEVTETLENTVSRVEVKRGDTLLFAPACASFDQFDGYEHRGREFKRLVNERFN